MNSLPIHQNPLIADYIDSRYFSGFYFRVESDRVVLGSTDSVILAILTRIKLTKDDDEKAELDVFSLISKRLVVKKATRDMRFQYEPEAVDLLEALNTLHAFSDPSIKQRLSDGFAMYGDMPVLFPRGTEVVCPSSSGLLGGIVESCMEVSTVFGAYYNLALSVILPTSKGACIGKIYQRISAFDNKIAIDKLNVRPIQPWEKAALAERGKQFRAFTKGPTLVSYLGNLTIPSWMRDRVIGTDGRAMVDPGNLAQINADLYHEMMGKFEIDEEANAEYVNDNDLWRCYNRVQGFSMRLKRWGWLDVHGLSAVNWRDDAFDHLVLASEHKQIMFNLVKHYGNSFADFIDGKSGGLVFLLFGPTGVGKTISAEAVAETLHRPLYSVSVGELGTEPDQLEDNLRSILDVAYQWNAVLLLDEADIFMEARDTNNIQRNAMVSIFLRQLEYYAGVMFLTTNRVKTFDPAFFSRISLAIAYPDLGETDRQEVWRNIFRSAEVDSRDIDIQRLSQFDVNGRNIKTAVRIAQTLAAGEVRPVRYEDLAKVLRLTEQFKHDIS